VSGNGIPRSGPDETMRQRMRTVITDLAEADDRLFGLFSDISCGDYFSAAMAAHPERMVNVGIMEQTVETPVGDDRNERENADRHHQLE